MKQTTEIFYNNYGGQDRVRRELANTEMNKIGRAHV